MTEIWIYDDIGPDWMGLISSKQIIGELAKAKGKPVTVRINSPGGDVVEAQAIYNALRRHSSEGGKVTVEIDALAASAASFIAMAGDSVSMAENAMMMIHKSWSVSVGNADAMRSTAEVLDKFDGILAATYAARSKMSADDVMPLLEAETWMTAAEAVDKGFADEVGQPLKVAASIKEGRYAKTPSKFLVSELPREHARKERERVASRLRVAVAARA